jgi:hydroxyethylthiazole kinase
MFRFTRLYAVKQDRPLIHCVSNIVSANDSANLALAVGARPIMAQAPEEMADITAVSAATVLNTGTPDEAKFESCLRCGRAAQRSGKPVVLDPVGVGASLWRLRRTEELLSAFTPSILRVNLGEAGALLDMAVKAHGVDSPEEGPEARVRTAKALAKKYHTAVLLSGASDIITDGRQTFVVTGGSAMMASVTGTGCMLSTLCGVFSAVEPEPVAAAALSAVFWKICAQEAETAAGAQKIGSFRTELFNAASALSAEDLAHGARSMLIDAI